MEFKTFVLPLMKLLDQGLGRQKQQVAKFYSQTKTASSFRQSWLLTLPSVRPGALSLGGVEKQSSVLRREGQSQKQLCRPSSLSKLSSLKSQFFSQDGENNERTAWEKTHQILHSYIKKKINIWVLISSCYHFFDTELIGIIFKLIQQTLCHLLSARSLTAARDVHMNKTWPLKSSHPDERDHLNGKGVMKSSDNQGQI